MGGLGGGLEDYGFVVDWIVDVNCIALLTAYFLLLFSYCILYTIGQALEVMRGAYCCFIASISGFSAQSGQMPKRAKWSRLVVKP